MRLSPRRLAPLLVALAWLTLGPGLMAQPLPQQLGSFQSTGEFTDFEQRPGGAGLGVSMGYARKDGARATLYLYDRGRRRAPEGGQNPDLPAELAQTVRELTAAIGQGYYTAVTPVETNLLITGNGNYPGIRCSNFRLTRNDGSQTGESVCVTVLAGRFVKARVSLRQSDDVQQATFAAIELMLEMQLRAARRG